MIELTLKANTDKDLPNRAGIICKHPTSAHQQVCRSGEKIVKRIQCGDELQKDKNPAYSFASFQHNFLSIQLKYKTQFMKIKAECSGMRDRN